MSSPEGAAPSSRAAGALVCGLFFLSGAAALLFETLWFRQAGLMLGNTVWAASLVTASFMAGLALGSALAARLGTRVTSPLRAYALLELVVAVTGVGLVLAFPHLTRALAPALRPALDQPGLLNAIRLLVAGALLIVPATAMGATLPLLVRFLTRRHGSYGWALGQLYGWNTVGAMAGALVGEAVLIEAVGVRGSAAIAGGLNVVAALLAMGAAVKLGAEVAAEAPLSSPPAPAPPARLSRRTVELLAAAFVAGGLLLALETVWFRFLQLVVVGTSAAFAVMLAVVLLGIGLGGFLASLWLRRTDAERHAVPLALLGGVAVVASYAGFPDALVGRTSTAALGESHDVFLVSLRLILATCLVSGVLFTLLGRALQVEHEEETRATGWLTLANTVGAMCGALLGGFVLLPRLGMERSFFVLAAGYGLVALLVRSAPAPGRRSRPLAVGAGALWLFFLVLFPFGLLDRRVLKRVADRWGGKDTRIVAFREGLTETVVLFRKELFGEPLYHRLVTNSSSMAGTTVVARRYMGLFAWWPVVLHPNPKHALLISYGCGVTARALTETRALETIDVVDISKNILGLSPFLNPARDPLDDPRVKVHVEDGRFHLLVSSRKYDLITAEPPPLKDAGIASLYSREFFALLRERLAEGGLATYWLPVHQLSERETRSIIGAFCAVFDDCSLWTGWGTEWMLAGSRNARGPVSREAFGRQWEDPVVGKALRDAGLEIPEQLGATFLADASTLRALAAGAPLLEDDFPYVLSPRIPPMPTAPLYVELMETAGARERFERSELIREFWPPDLRQGTLEWFLPQAAINKYCWAATSQGPSPTVRDLEPILTGTPLQTAVLWLMGTSPEAQQIVERAEARGLFEPIMDVDRGMRRMAARDYAGAEEAFARAEPLVNYGHHLRVWRILALAAGGDRKRAAALLADSGEWRRRPGAGDGSWEWLAQRFDLPLPPLSGE